MKIETHELKPIDAGSILRNFFKTLWATIKALFGYLRKLHQVWNEGWILVLGLLAWRYTAQVLQIVDVSLIKAFSHDLMRFFYATVGTAIAHFVVTAMLWLSHPNIFRYLYGLFYVDLYKPEGELKASSLKHDLKIIRLKYSWLVFAIYLGTWLILAATY